MNILLKILLKIKIKSAKDYSKQELTIRRETKLISQRNIKVNIYFPSTEKSTTTTLLLLLNIFTLIIQSPNAKQLDLFTHSKIVKRCILVHFRVAILNNVWYKG